MNFRSYNKELTVLLGQFLDTINNITIDRRNSQNNTQKLIDVPCVIGTRSRILKSIENKNKTLSLPIIGINYKNVIRDVGRTHSIHDELLHQIGDTYNPNLKQPIAIKMSVEMNIITKYQEDLHQIIQNWLPFFNPVIYFTYKNPKNTTKKVHAKVIWDGNIDFDVKIDKDPTDPERPSAITLFDIKGYVFPGMSEISGSSGGPIEEDYIKTINMYCLPANIPNDLSGEAVLSGNIAPSGLSDKDAINNYGFGLENWYEVPYTQTMDEYQANIVKGWIDTPNFDNITLSSNNSLCGTTGFFV